MSDTHNKHLSAVFKNRKTVLEVLHNLQQVGIDSTTIRSRAPLEQNSDDMRTYSGNALRDNTPTMANEGLDPTSLSLPASQRPVNPASGTERLADATSYTGLYRDPLTGISSETEVDRQQLSTFTQVLAHKGLAPAEAERYASAYESHHYLLLVDDLSPEMQARAASIIDQSQPVLSSRF